MKGIGIIIFIVCVYCFPFAYFSMYQDFSNRSMLGYLFMIVATALFAGLSKKYSHISIIFIGNIVSLVVSYFFIGTMAENVRWDGYFKPLTANKFLILIGILNIIPQLVVIKFVKKKCRRQVE